MGKKISDSEGKELARLFIKEVTENGLTANQVGTKYHYSATTVGVYVRRYIKDKNLINKFNKTMLYNKTHHSNIERKENSRSITKELENIKRRTVAKSKPGAQNLVEFYKKYCMEIEPYGAIRLALKTGIDKEIAEREYKKFREELRRM